MLVLPVPVEVIGPARNEFMRSPTLSAQNAERMGHGAVLSCRIISLGFDICWLGNMEVAAWIFKKS